MTASAAISSMHMIVRRPILHFRFSRYRRTASLTLARSRLSSDESVMDGVGSVIGLAVPISAPCLTWGLDKQPHKAGEGQPPNTH
jgi:hypothetical protein